MIKVMFKDGFGEEVCCEYTNLGERLNELQRINRQKIAANAVVTSKDVTRFNEIDAIEKMFAAEKTRDFLTPVIDKLIAENPNRDRNDALEVIATYLHQEGSWGFCKRMDALDLCNSAEEFSIQFMTAYNKEVYPRY